MLNCWNTVVNLKGNNATWEKHCWHDWGCKKTMFLYAPLARVGRWAARERTLKHKGDTKLSLQRTWTETESAGRQTPPICWQSRSPEGAHAHCSPVKPGRGSLRGRGKAHAWGDAGCPVPARAERRRGQARLRWPRHARLVERGGGGGSGRDEPARLVPGFQPQVRAARRLTGGLGPRR